MDEYEIDCDICESSCELYIEENEDYSPEFCPMCGSPLETT